MKVITLGCRLNIFESEVIRNHDLENTSVINTCAVTNEAIRQARQVIRKSKREDPNSRIIVTGCAAQLDSKSFSKMSEVDLVLGNEEKLNVANYTIEGSGLRRVGDIMSKTVLKSKTIERFEKRVRAFVQIQQGCDHRCTFCIIPFARGNSRSVPIDRVIFQTRKLVSNGHREIVLTGVDIASYGNDLPERVNLGGLVRRILSAVPNLDRLRLSSLDTTQIDPDLEQSLIEEHRLMPHLHLSLQSGDDIILKRMKRRHSRQDAINLTKRLAKGRPGIVFGADIIAGFPTETEVMFHNTLSLIDECDLTWVHVFPYSQRSNTPAARMPQVAPQVRKRRASEIRSKGELAFQKFLKNQIGQEQKVLIEKVNFGRAENFAGIQLDGNVEIGSLVNVKIVNAFDRGLIGEFVK